MIVEYLWIYKDLVIIYVICEDYCVLVGIDLDYDEVDEECCVLLLFLVIWGENSVVGYLYDVEVMWKEKGI